MTIGIQEGPEFHQEYIGDLPNGHGLWRQTHKGTGHTLYWSSEVDGVGVVVWDTFVDLSSVWFAAGVESQR